MTSSSPVSRPIDPILWLKVFLDFRLQHESLEGLMDFLAFLVQKFWQNKQKLIGESPLIREFLQDLRSFGPNFGTRNARQFNYVSKHSYHSLEST